MENGKERMKTPNIWKDDGYVFVTVIFIIAILTMSAVAIATMSQTESNIVRNERLYMGEFYNADSGIGVASEVFTSWHNQLKSSNGKNGYSYNLTLPGESGSQLLIEALKIEESYGSFKEGLSDFAKNLPSQKHIDDPLLGSGTGVTGEVLIRRFSLTAKPVNGNLQIQTGIYKYIPGKNI